MGVGVGVVGGGGASVEPAHCCYEVWIGLVWFAVLFWSVLVVWTRLGLNCVVRRKSGGES